MVSEKLIVNVSCSTLGCVIIIWTSDNMIRTQITVNRIEYALVKKEAEGLGISVAEFVRRAIRNALPTPGASPWMRYAGFVESGNAQSSQTIDDVVYGAKD